MKAFNPLFILSLSFFLSQKAVDAAPIPVAGTSDARDQKHELKESKVYGISNSFGFLHRRMDALENRMDALEQKKHEEQKKSDLRRAWPLSTRALPNFSGEAKVGIRDLASVTGGLTSGTSSIVDGLANGVSTNSLGNMNLLSNLAGSTLNNFGSSKTFARNSFGGAASDPLISFDSGLGKRAEDNAASLAADIGPLNDIGSDTATGLISDASGAL